MAGAKLLIADHLAGKVRLAPVDAGPVPLPAALPVIDRGLALPLSEGLKVEAQGFARCKGTVDMDLGMKNFIQNGPRVPAAFLHE